MRIIPYTIALAALLVSSAASASGGSDKTPGKGASGPAAASGGTSGGGGGLDVVDDRDRAGAGGTSSFKTWEVGVGAEYHHTGFNGESIDAGLNRNVMYYSAYAKWDPSPFDRLSASFGVYEYFLADNGEHGARLDDLAIKYTRRVPLPAQVTLRLSGSLTAPTSYGSQLAGIYTVPRIGVELDRKFGRWFSLDARAGGGLFLAKYASGGASYNGGGNSGFGLGNNGGGATPNPKALVSLGLSAELTMPFHTPLSVGISLYTAYTWFYDVCGNGMLPGSMDMGQSAFGYTTGTTGTCSTMPAVMDPGQQPVAQSYGGEFTVRYELPVVARMRSDLLVAYAPLGDATLGYASVQHGTGVDHVYPFWRQNAEMYFGLNARY